MAVFVYLVIVGFQASRQRWVSLYRLPIMPLIFIIWSLYSKQALHLDALAIWFCFCIIATASGFYMTKKLSINVDSTNKLVQLPGSWFPLLLSMIFFAIKYGLGVTYALDPFARESFYLLGFDLSISGIVSGLSLGRLLV
jgi:Family of unknown function (DUF6622)